MTRLIFLRHALAVKNIEDRHGGGGSILSDIGVSQLKELIKAFTVKGIKPTNIFFSPVPHAEQTAKIIAEYFKIEHVKENLLMPLNLGVLAGLSREEAKKKYPSEADLIEQWRKGLIELHELIIPEAESYKDFYKRGIEFFSQISHLSGDILIVGTRSILILLMSILLGRTAELGGGYKEIPMDCCDFFIFQKASQGFVFDKDKSYCKSGF